MRKILPDDTDDTVWLCPICRQPLTTWTDEHDYLCATHQFVNPIRSEDGMQVSGDGQCGVPVATTRRDRIRRHL